MRYSKDELRYSFLSGYAARTPTETAEMKALRVRLGGAVSPEYVEVEVCEDFDLSVFVECDSKEVCDERD